MVRQRGGEAALPLVKKRELRDFFFKQPWYRPDPNWDDAKDSARISERDKANAAFIRDYERRSGC
jgi:hypothetical protein